MVLLPYVVMVAHVENEASDASPRKQSSHDLAEPEEPRTVGRLQLP